MRITRPYLLLAALNIYWGLEARVEHQGYPTIGGLIALWCLWMAKRQFDYLRFLADRRQSAAPTQGPHPFEAQ